MDTGSQKEEEEAKEKEEKEAKAKRPNAATAVIPNLPFKSDEFTEAWIEWSKYRTEIKHSLTPTTIKKQLSFLGGRSEKEAIAIINQSIEKGWQGLFELDKNKSNGKQKFAGKGTAEGMVGRHQLYEQMLGK